MKLNNPLPLDSDQWTKLRAYRLARVQEALKARSLGAIIVFDPCNIRYATGSRNMAVWTLHNHVRYAFVPAEGLPTVFEFAAGRWETETHLLETVGEVRPPQSWTHFYSGSKKYAHAAAWADEIQSLLQEFAGNDQSLAFDHLDPPGADELRKRGIEIVDGEPVMEHARLIKSDEELTCIRHALDVAMIGMHSMRELLAPGMTENQLWSLLHQANISHNGEWIETRLLSSGYRTNPWMQESSDKVIEAGELVAFDTDMIGPNGYCADVSRTFLCGGSSASDEQRRLYQTAFEQIHHNVSQVAPGRTLHDLSENEWPFPEEFLPYRYGVAHGVGLKDEYPFIVNAHDIDHLSDPEQTLLPGMVLSFESYIGAVGGHEGVKLEEQIVVTDNGYELLAEFPFEDRLLSNEV
ncbi:MAG: Xaa-Pro peptidase family protein [Pseudomonadota bacterium]